jgi:tRNA-2-methylthio-N6-dimethylallyladenosine synthase
MRKSYHIWTIGCQMNEADSRHLGSQLESLGYAAVSAPEEADLVVLNTCVVRQQSEDKAVGKLHAVRHLKERRPDLRVGLMGCLVGLKEEPALRRRFPFVDVFMPPSETRPLMEFLGVARDDAGRALDARERAIRDAVQDEEHVLPALSRGRAVTANVPIVLGCSHACSFCVIPYRRGAEKSLPPDVVLREVRALAAQGVREVMLLGQIVDRYGEDLPGRPDLGDLLREVAAVEGLLRVRFLTAHPNYMTDRILEAVRDTPKVCPHLELPIQSGDDEVLARMRRGYTVDDFRAVVARARRILPHATLNTDVIVGFPGETEAQFLNTCRVLEELRLDKVHLSRYSERPKTIAARQMPDDVPAEEKERRWHHLDAICERILTEKNASLLGTEVEVLVEDQSHGKWRGRTPHNRLVFIRDDRPLRGALVSTRVTWTGPFTLQAEGAEIRVPAATAP